MRRLGLPVPTLARLLACALASTASIETATGQQLLRNWESCRAPLVAQPINGQVYCVPSSSGRSVGTVPTIPVPGAGGSAALIQGLGALMGALSATSRDSGEDDSYQRLLREHDAEIARQRQAEQQRQQERERQQRAERSRQDAADLAARQQAEFAAADAKWRQSQSSPWGSNSGAPEAAAPTDNPFLVRRGATTLPAANSGKPVPAGSNFVPATQAEVEQITNKSAWETFKETASAAGRNAADATADALIGAKEGVDQWARDAAPPKAKPNAKK